MFKYFWNKLKTFFISRSRLSRLTVVLVCLVVMLALFGLGHSVFADDGIMKSIASVFGDIFLLIAAFLGQILVVIIGILLEIISYNNFMDAEAVNTGWTVVRDVCNLFFVLILLVIGFGSVLRLENFKYNQLLGKLVIMIVLVNFSKMIAGFFIDVSQVVLMTFSNAFAATAAANFTSGLKLQKMLGFIDSGGNSTITGLGALETFGVALLPVALLLVAIFVMIAMVAVFVMRILMLWILIVLSPLAYLFSVLPATQQYGKQWWTTFTKWVSTGPALAFFIWFGLTLIAGGGTGQIDLKTENQIVDASASGGLAGSVSAVSSSDNLLQFGMAIGLFIISLVMAQSLGGMAGSFAGKMLGKLQTMGGAAMKYTSPAYWGARGAGELAKMGGRKIRRTYRDSKLGKYTNVGAMIAGAKKRGEEVESLSKERGVAQGKEIWDRRPDWMGGGADVIPETQLVEARYERKIAAEVSTLQKEQKAGLLEKIWDKGGKQNELTRRAILQSLAAEGHVDDALDTDFFKNKAKWTDANREAHEGFKNKDTGNWTDEEITSNFFRATISGGAKRSAQKEKISKNAVRTLYDIEDLGKKAKHYEYCGEVGTDENGELELKDMDFKREIIVGEIEKQTDRNKIGNHPHNISAQADSMDGETMRLIQEFDKDHKVTAGYKNFIGMAAYAKENQKGFKEYSQPRLAQLLGKLDSETKKFKIHDDPRFLEHLEKLYREAPEMLSALELKAGSTGYTFDGKNYKDLNEFARAKVTSTNGRKTGDDALEGYKNGYEKKSWVHNPNYHQKDPSEIAAEEKSKKEFEAEKISANRNENLAKDSKKKAEAKKAEAEKYKNESESAENPILKNRMIEKSEQSAKEAEELHKKSKAYELDATVGKARLSVKEFQSESSNSEAITQIQTDITTESIEKLSQAINQSLEKIKVSPDGLDVSDLEQQFNGVATTITDTIGKLGKIPDNIKAGLKTNLSNLSMGINSGEFRKRNEQLRVFQVLENIRNILARRKQGKGVDKGEAIVYEKKKKEEEEYDTDD